MKGFVTFFEFLNAMKNIKPDSVITDRKTKTKDHTQKSNEKNIFFLQLYALEITKYLKKFIILHVAR